MNAASLFSGIGGMDAGLARAGWKHVFFCELDPWRREVLAARWPGVPIYDDVRVVGIEPAPGTADDGRGTEPDRAERLHTGSVLDLLCGGFPCQDVSVAGKRRGLAGERSGLYFEFARIIDAFRPRWVLIENVPGLLSSNGGRDFGVVLGTLADLGYGVAWRILDSRFFGVPQRRRRVFIVGTLAHGDPRAAAERAGEVLAVGSRCPGHPPTGGETREDAAAASTVSTLASSGKSGGWRIGADEAAGGQLVAAPLTKGSASGEGVNAPGRRQEDDVNIVAYPISGDALRQGDAKTPSADAEGRVRLRDPGLGVGSAGDPAFTPTKTHPGAIAYALNAKKGYHDGDADTNYVAGSGVRRLTPRECERLQGLPDDWTLLDEKTPDSRRYSALGDAVTANVSEWIGARIAEREREAVA